MASIQPNGNNPAFNTCTQINNQLGVNNLSIFNKSGHSTHQELEDIYTQSSGRKRRNFLSMNKLRKQLF